MEGGDGETTAEWEWELGIEDLGTEGRTSQSTMHVGGRKRGSKEQLVPKQCSPEGFR